MTLAVGVRNSLDKSFPMGFAAGSRVFCCDNLALRADLLVRRKHTAHGLARFAGAIAGAVGSLRQFREAEAVRIGRMRAAVIDDAKAESVMLRAYAAKVVSHLVLPEVLRHWQTPAHPQFAPRTVFSLLNAFTSAMGPRARSNPQAYAAATMRLFGVLDDNFPALAAPVVTTGGEYAVAV